MKNSILIGVCLCFSFTVKAQLQNGKGYIGGTISFSGSTSELHPTDNKSESYEERKTVIVPELQFGYFVNNTTLIGLGARYGLQSNVVRESPVTPGYSTTNQSIALLPFIRKYKSLGGRWAIFLHGEVGPSYQFDKYFQTDLNRETKGNNWQYKLSVKPGVVYLFPNKKWAVEAYTDLLSLNATYLPMNNDNDEARQIMLTTGISTSFPTYFSLRIAKYLSSKNQ